MDQWGKTENDLRRLATDDMLLRRNGACRRI
jgi:hypothetical protein